MRPYFIVNPIAGGGMALEKFKAATAYLDSRGAEYGCVLTEREHQSTALAEEAYANGERMIVAVGGDGTVNEVASALCNRSDAAMGIFPFGTGNDLARVLRLPTEPKSAAELLLGGEAKPIDMGLAGNTPFINVGGMGFDVDVVINTERYKGRFHGMLPYIFGIIRSLSHLRGLSVKVTTGGVTTKEELLLCSVCNGSHLGGGMNVAPEADASDGLFDVCMIKKIGLIPLLMLLPKFIKGKHLGKKPVRYFRTDEITFECERTPLQLDGELGSFAPVRFKVLPHALRVVMP